MPFELTNVTQSIANVPFNKKDERPTYIVFPNTAVVVPDAYVEQLDEDTRDRFLRVISGDHPVFRVKQVDVSPPAPPAPKASKASSKKGAKTVVAEPVSEPVIDVEGEVVADEPSPISDPVS